MQIIPFNFESNPVRILQADNQSWFVANDICAALGYSNPRQAIATHVHDDDKGVQNIDTPGGPQKVGAINESGLYALIFGSKKEQAQRFKRWVTSEVLPSIRKTGTYHQIPQTLPEALRLAADQAEQIQKQQILIEQQRPSVEFVERFVEARSAKSLREVAKVLNVKEKEFIENLVEQKILFRQSGNILPFGRYHHRGFFTVKTGEANGHAYYQTRFTPEGISWISKRLGLVSGGAAL